MVERVLAYVRLEPSRSYMYAAPPPSARPCPHMCAAWQPHK
jgi:hypothetical protein